MLCVCVCNNRQIYYFIQHRLTYIFTIYLMIIYDGSIVNLCKPKGEGLIELLLHELTVLCVYMHRQRALRGL